MKNVKTLFSEFLNSEILIDYCNYTLANLKNGIIDKTPNILYDSRMFSINILYVNLSEQKLLPSNLNEKYISVLPKEKDYSYRLYRLENVQDPKVLDKSKKLKLEKEGVLKNKEILHIQPFVHVLQSTSDFEGFLLTAESKIFQDFIWYFDMDTLFPISYNFTNKDHKRLEGTIELLNEIANNNSIEPLYKLAFHQNHTIRWKSLQKLINLDFDKGVEVLEYMEDNDSHVEIRYAAKKTLERIQKKY